MGSWLKKQFILNLNENAKQFEFRLSYTVHYKRKVFANWISIGIYVKSGIF